LEKERYTLEEAHLAFAKQANGRVWQLLDQPHRTREETEEMLHAAHASLFHWLHAGTGLHHQRGQWMITRVHIVLGNPGEALRHARRCLELTEQHRELMQDFDLAFAYEGVARAQACAGNPTEARSYHERAREAGAAIEDEEDRKIFFDDFEGGDWFGVRS
jgi:hypothetical protein